MHPVEIGVGRSRHHGEGSMQFAVTFRHMEPTEALKAYAQGANGASSQVPSGSDLPATSCSAPNATTTASTSPSSCTTASRSPATRRPRTCTARSISCIAKIERQVRKYKGKLEGTKARAAPRASRCRGRTRSSPRRSTSIDETNGNGRAPCRRRTTTPDRTRVQGRQDREVPRPADVGRRTRSCSSTCCTSRSSCSGTTPTAASRSSTSARTARTA